MSLKMNLAKLWILFVLLLGGVVLMPVSTMVVAVDEQTIAESGQPGAVLMGECDGAGTCGT